MTCLRANLKNYAKAELPKLVVFDLDYTLWPFWVDTHVNPPFSRDRNGQVVDHFKRKIHMYPDVSELLQELKLLECFVAAASRTETPKEAFDLLQILGIHECFDFKEIYPGRKTAHFARFQEPSGIAYRDMIFFDDELRNINDISKLGVTCIHVESGISMSNFLNGIQQHIAKCNGL